jgi:hypothetical protein|nr:MAG TPA: hypothetical protein [Herelleviridae sp.]
MGQLTLTMKYRKNEGLLLSPTEMFSLYLYGIKIQAGDGTAFSTESMRFYIQAAQQEIENFFNLKLVYQFIALEKLTFYRADYWQSFPILFTNYPVNKPISLTGRFNQLEQISYPTQWLTNTQNSYGQYKRRVSIVPTGTAVATANAEVILSGLTTQLGSQHFLMIPDYWDLQYITGFKLDQMPMDLINLTGKLASFGPLGIAGDLILGAGIASQSLGVDGLSQSISSTSSATNAGYGARLVQYEREIKATIPRIKLVYDEIKMSVL